MKLISRHTTRIGALATCGLAILLNSCSQPLQPNTDTTKVTETTSSSSSSSPLLVWADVATLAPSGTTTIGASGGTTPYNFYVSSGGGSVGHTSGAFQAPSSAGTVVVGVQDASGATATTTISVVSSGSGSGSGSGSSDALSLTIPAVILGNQSLSLAATGGISPYTYTVVAGNGTISGTSFTPTNSSQTTVTIQATDASGGTAQASTQVVASTILTASGNIWADTNVGITYDNYGNTSYPQLVIFGTGPNTASASSLAMNGDACKNGSLTDILSPCAIKIPLKNLSKTGLIQRTYSGVITIAGQSATAVGDFCVLPGDPNTATFKWVTSVSPTYQNISYNAFGVVLLVDRTMKAAYSVIDSASGAHYATVTISDSRYRPSTTDCGFTSDKTISATSK